MTMKNNLKTDNASIIELRGQQISPADLSKAQWMLIRGLERQYVGKVVYGTNSKFEDTNWFNTETMAGHARGGINWRLYETSEPALRVLSKAFLFDAISDGGLELGTAKSKISRLRDSIIPLIGNKNLLTGKNGSVLLGLSLLTDDDLMVMLDTLIVSQKTESQIISKCSDIAAFHTFANHIAEQVPVYQIHARLPWEKLGQSITKWIKKRAAELNVIFSNGDGYEPLPTETVQPLIEKSLTLIDLHFDHFVEIMPLVATYTHDTKYERGIVLALLHKYGPIFGPIKAPPDISGLSKTRLMAGRVFGWLRDLLYLARGACVNVILLTTGLRNVDVRGLRVGACRQSGRVDMLFYLRADIQKTKNVIILPVPGQTDKSIRLLEKIKFTDSPYLIDAGMFPLGHKALNTADVRSDTNDEFEARHNYGDALNEMIRYFAAHFNIPFISNTTGTPYSVHCCRTTVAGWLGSASNLSILLVRRLFGHSNNVMPTVYLNNNPTFVAERDAQKARAHAETARQMGLAASQGRLAGVKGEQLERGFQEHKSRMEAEKQKSHSLTDAEILMTFNQILEQRISSGSVCAFLTPFGVQCMRNPSDSSQPPCAKRANRDKTQDIDPELLQHVSDINPQQCIGTSCTEAVLGPWSTSVLETLNWYRALLSHQLGDMFNEENFIVSAKHFIQQYEKPLAKVFGIVAFPSNLEVPPDGLRVTQSNV